MFGRKKVESPEGLIEVVDRMIEVDTLMAEAIFVQGDRIDQLSRGVEATYEVIGMAREAIALGNLAMTTRLKEMPAGWRGETLDEAELSTFAEMFPEWSVTTGISNGVASKTYARSIDKNDLRDDRLPGGKLDRDTYLSLCDVEHSDMKLAGFFGSYHVFGDDVDNRRYEFRIVSEEAGPITMTDLVRVSDAEAYIREEYLSPYYETPAAEEAFA